MYYNNLIDNRDCDDAEPALVTRSSHSDICEAVLPEFA
jgi:hypothetical protein